MNDMKNSMKGVLLVLLMMPLAALGQKQYFQADD